MPADNPAKLSEGAYPGSGSAIVAIIRLLVCPHRLCATALRVPLWLALVAGLVSMWLILAVPAVVVAAAIDEPFESLPDYLTHVRSATAFVGAGLFGLVLATAMWMATLRDGNAGREDLAQAGPRVVLLAPVAVLGPYAAWGTAFVLLVGRNNMDVSAAPAWMSSPVLTWLGSCHWPPLLTIACAVFLRMGLRDLDRYYDAVARGACPRCGYERGNGVRRCPECGSAEAQDSSGPRRRGV